MKLRDKVLHRIVGFGCVVLGALIGHRTGSVLIGAEVGMGLGAVLARVKEAYDLRHPEKHTSDGWDALATVEGALLAHALVLAMLLANPL